MRRTRWIVLGGCFLAYLFDALEIVLLSMGLPAIRTDMGLTVTQGGLLATATLVGIGVSSVLGGYIADNFGRKKALLASLATFGAFTAAIAVVPNFEVFLLLRFLAASAWARCGAWSRPTWSRPSPSTSEAGPPPS